MTSNWAQGFLSRVKRDARIKYGARAFFSSLHPLLLFFPPRKDAAPEFRISGALFTTGFCFFDDLLCRPGHYIYIHNRGERETREVRDGIMGRAGNIVSGAQTARNRISREKGGVC